MVTGHADDKRTDSLVDFPYFKNYYKMIVIDSSKQQELGADPKTIQQIKFNENLNRDGNTRMFFIIKEIKETVLDFSQETVKVLLLSTYELATACSEICFCFDMISIYHNSV